MARVPHPIKPSHVAMTYKEPLTVRVGRYAMTGGLVVGLLLILYSLAWFVTSMTLRSSLQDWFAARQAEGYLAQYDEKQARISGFPFVVRASLNDVRFAPPKVNGKHPWSWSSQKVDFLITPLPWSLGTLKVDISTRQSIQAGGYNYSGKAKEFYLELDWITDGIPDDMLFVVERAAFEDKAKGKVFKVNKLHAKTERLSSGNYSYDINGENVGLPVGVAGMGNRLSEVILRGELTENFGALGVGKTNLAAWRDAGGTLEAQRIHFQYPPLLIQGNGTMGTGW